MIPFAKYQATGNDFVMIDDRAQAFPADNQPLIEQLCHRRFGIGADGLILLQAADGYDFRMVYFNADGREGSMCGNGGRCIVQFAADLGVIKTQTRFIAVDGEHEATVDDAQGVVSLKMSDVQAVEQKGGYIFLNTGSPHAIIFSDAVADVDVATDGAAIRHHAVFAPGGTNVNFVERIADGSLYVRTFERGVEAETYSCGTGVTAAALAAHRQFGLSSPVAIEVLGGHLRVEFTAAPGQGFRAIYLIGPAQRVFTGQINSSVLSL